MPQVTELARGSARPGPKPPVSPSVMVTFVLSPPGCSHLDRSRPLEAAATICCSCFLLMRDRLNISLIGISCQTSGLSLKTQTESSYSPEWQQSAGPALSSTVTSAIIKREINAVLKAAPFAPFAFRYDEKNKQFAILIIQLSNLSALLLQQDQKV